MTKAETTTALNKAKDMKGWKLKDWAAFHRTYASQETIGRLHEIDNVAYKTFMKNEGLEQTEAAGGHYATLSPKKGASYVDIEALYAELREMGINIDDLISKHTKSRPDTVVFKFI